MDCRKSVNKKIIITAWDEDNFEMNDLDTPIRFVEFRRQPLHIIKCIVIMVDYTVLDSPPPLKSTHCIREI
jgi:hypothetical protein